MSVKQYTTPTFEITINDENAEELISTADEIIVTVSDGTIDIDLVPEAEGDTLIVTMTQEQTEQLALGVLQIEATFKFGSRIVKTRTMTDELIEAVRDRVME